MDQIAQWGSIIIMLVVFYLIIFIPENKKKKKYANMLTNLKVNDEILTKGGIMGKILNINEDNVIVQSGPDKMRFKLNKTGILEVVNSKTEETPAETKE